MRRKIKCYLIVWKKAHEFVIDASDYTKDFPQSELYGLTSQFRRAAVSIAAKGFKKRDKKDKVRFMNISQGSIEECRYYIILPKDLGYGNQSELDDKLQDMSKLIDVFKSHSEF